MSNETVIFNIINYNVICNGDNPSAGNCRLLLPRICSLNIIVKRITSTTKQLIQYWKVRLTLLIKRFMFILAVLNNKCSVQVKNADKDVVCL